jgi:aspartate racemase
MNDKVIGIIGGIGPWATLEEFKRFLESVPAKRDQDYPRLIIYCNSKIPDRRKSILAQGESAIPALKETAQALEQAGVDFIIIGSNGTHYYYGEIQQAVSIPVINMIEETSMFIKTRYSYVKNIGLIAPDVTCEKGIYQRYFQNSDQSLIIPDDELQQKITDAVYEVKVGKFDTGKESLIEVAKDFIDQGAEGVICGCTEISVVLHEKDLNVPVIDPMQIVVDKAIKMAQGDNIT